MKNKKFNKTTTFRSKIKQNIKPSEDSSLKSSSDFSELPDVKFKNHMNTQAIQNISPVNMIRFPT